MFNKIWDSDKELINALPKTMATQHPDNISSVPFGDKTPYVPFYRESDETLYTFKELGIDELMHDLEGKKGHLHPVRQLLQQFEQFFTENPLGGRFRLTPRLPNPINSPNDPLLYLAQEMYANSIITMQDYDLKADGLTEFIIPDTTDGRVLGMLESHIIKTYELTRSRYQEYTGHDIKNDKPFFIQGIPLIEDYKHLARPDLIWMELIEERKKRLGIETFVQRGFIARSDPSLKAGMIPAIIAATLALSKSVDYENETGIYFPQIIGVGGPSSRGGLTPETIDEFLKTYPGVATATIQSAFRYDYPAHTVRASIAELREKITSRWLDRKNLTPKFSCDETQELIKIMDIFSTDYIQSINEVYDAVQTISKYIPENRDRDPAIGLHGYGRQIEGKKWPRAIKTIGSFASLGLPHGLLGTRAYYRLSSDQQKLTLKANSMIPYWINRDLGLLNEDCIGYIKGLDKILDDVEASKAFAFEKGLRRELNEEHTDYTCQVIDDLNKGNSPIQSIEMAARARKYLG